MELDHLVLAVSDLEASLPWYDELLPRLGFRKTRAHVWVNGQGFGFDLQQANEPGRGYARAGVGLNHLAVRAPSRAAVDEVARAMASVGFEVPAVQELDGAYALFLKDRDGMRIEVTFEG
jgi:lactoylglutathione lyase